MFFLLFLLWIVFNGKITLEICLFGIVICGAIYLFMRKVMGYNPKVDKLIAKRAWKGICYYLFLIKEILKSCFAVTKIILTGASEIKPKLVHFTPDLSHEGSRVVLANSITLTPGTITVTIRDGEYVVHALDDSMAEGIEDCEFIHKLREIDGEDKEEHTNA